MNPWHVRTSLDPGRIACAMSALRDPARHHPFLFSALRSRRWRLSLARLWRRVPLADLVAAFVFGVVLALVYVAMALGVF